MCIPKTKSKSVYFRGFDGKRYIGWTCGIKNDVLTVKYRVPRMTELASAYLERAEFHRITARAA